MSNDADAGPGQRNVPRQAVTAIILAAGRGSRMAPLTSGPKCLLPLHGRPLLHHQLDLLARCGIDDVVVVTGFEAAAVRAAAEGRARFVHAPDYASTNNLATLRGCRELLVGEVVVAFADVLVSADDLRRLVDDARDLVLLVDPSVRRDGTMRIRHENRSILDVGPHISPERGTGSFVGVARLGPGGSAALAAELAVMAGPAFADRYYTDAVANLARAGRRVSFVTTAPGRWIELDTPEDAASAAAETFYLAPDAGATGVGEAFAAVAPAPDPGPLPASDVSPASGDRARRASTASVASTETG